MCKAWANAEQDTKRRGKKRGNEAPLYFADKSVVYMLFWIYLSGDSVSLRLHRNMVQLKCVVAGGMQCRGQESLILFCMP